MQAVIDTNYTFHVLFVDENGAGLAVTTPKIDIYGFTSSGVKTYYVQQAALSAASPAETGRYTYTYTIPSAFTDGQQIYADLTGTDPVTAALLRVEQQVTIIAATRADSSGGGGITARFVKGG